MTQINTIDLIRNKLNDTLVKYEINSNNFFRLVKMQVLTREQLCKMMIPFYYAVARWVDHLKLVSEMIQEKYPEISEHDMNYINDNIRDEMGNGDPNESHIVTFRGFLESLGLSEYDLLLNTNSDRNRDTAGDAFNNKLSDYLKNKTLIENLCLLGAIEYYYVFISGFIINNMEYYIKGVQKHYTNHEVLDIKHSEYLFKLALVLGNISETELDTSIDDGYKMLYDLYESLIDIDNLKSPVFFAQVREDPEVELEYLRFGCDTKALVIASGGDTILSIIDVFSKTSKQQNHLTIDAIDMNQSQLYLTELKRQLYENGCDLYDYWTKSFKIDDYLTKVPEAEHNVKIINFIRMYEHIFRNGISRSGRFETLFDLVREINQLRSKLSGWKVWFDRKILTQVFGPNAVKYSMNREFDDHFSEIEKWYQLILLGRPNYFVDQVLYGTYYPDSLPKYMTTSRDKRIKNKNKNNINVNYEKTSLMDKLKTSPDETFDLIHTSNITDWSRPEDLRELLVNIKRCLKPNGVVVMRRLNSDQKLKPFVMEYFRETKTVTDKSYFYSECLVGIK